MAVVRSVVQVGGGDQGELRRFRGEVYDCLDRRADALFDLIDGVCAPVEVAGIAYLSLPQKDETDVNAKLRPSTT